MIAAQQKQVNESGPVPLAFPTRLHFPKVELPEGFQRSEFLEEHGFLDFVVHRKNLQSEIARLIDFCGKTFG
jgi:hypothetical protein